MQTGKFKVRSEGKNAKHNPAQQTAAVPENGHAPARPICGRVPASLTAESAIVITLVLLLLLGTVVLALYEHDRVVLAVRLYEREMTGAEPRFLLSGTTQVSLRDGRIAGEHTHQAPAVPAVRDAVRSRAGTWPQAALVRLFSVLREELE